MTAEFPKSSMELIYRGALIRYHYLHNIVSEKARAFFADDRLVNPFLVMFLEMANLHQNREHNL
jgi:hypothetical protein